MKCAMRETKQKYQARIIYSTRLSFKTENEINNENTENEIQNQIPKEIFQLVVYVNNLEAKMADNEYFDFVTSPVPQW